MPTFTLAARNAALDAHNASLMVQVIRETDSTLPDRQVTGATAGGDERKLRGIPAIGRGVSGCIPGTSPHQLRSQP